MKVAFGLKAHSGWAALVVLGARGDDLQVVERRRLELVDDDALWAKQPFHAAAGLPPDEAREVVRRGVEAARRIAVREMRAAVQRAQDAGRQVVASGVLVGNPMPGWSVEEILAVHFRMHQAEGALFRDVLVRAVEACHLTLVAIPEKSLTAYATTALATPAGTLLEKIAALGRSVGPPWGKDQKETALAAMIALEGAR